MSHYAVWLCLLPALLPVEAGRLPGHAEALP